MIISHPQPLFPEPKKEPPLLPQPPQQHKINKINKILLLLPPQEHPVWQFVAVKSLMLEPPYIKYYLQFINMRGGMFCYRIINIF